MPRKDLEISAMGYRKHPGMVAWILHRVTGVLLVLYLWNFLKLLKGAVLRNFLLSLQY